MGGLRGVWARRGFRRTVYLLVAGAVVLEGAAWTLRRPFFSHWVEGRISRILKDETGLSFQADSLEFHLLSRKLIVRNFSLGGRLLQARRLELEVHPLSLLSQWPRIRHIHLDQPRLELDRQTLGQIHLKPHPPSAASPQVYLGDLLVSDARVLVKEPSWGIPRVEAWFNIRGTGRGANRLDAALQAPRLVVGEGSRAREGHLDLKTFLSEGMLEVRKGQLALGNSTLTLVGRYEPGPRRLNGEARGELNLAGVSALLPKGIWTGSLGKLGFKASVAGTIPHPTWVFTLQGRDLELPFTGLGRSALDLDAHGTEAHLELGKLSLQAPEGSLQASGGWERGKGSDLEFKASGVSLAPLASRVRFAPLARLQASTEGQLHLGGAPWERPDPDRLTVRLQGSFTQQGRSAGGVDLSVEGGRVQVAGLSLALEEVHLSGKAEGVVDRRGLAALSGSATLETDAAQVAATLDAWKLVKLDMGGATRAQAEVGWSRHTPLHLDGTVELSAPRWHGATAETLAADVKIEGTRLDVSQILAQKGSGTAAGELWVDWGPVPEGGPQIGMCYQADRLPIREGLRAADVDFVRVDGTGSGWVRIGGPFAHLTMEGQARALDNLVYGVKVPAVSADFSMDLSAGRFQVADLRVAGGPGALGEGDRSPEGPLALSGGLDMDLAHGNWLGSLEGQVDSRVLGLPGPVFKGVLGAKLQGPMVDPMGPIALPGMVLHLSGGSVELGTRTLEGLEGNLATGEGGVDASLGMTGRDHPFATLRVHPEGRGLSGALDVQVDPSTADTARLAAHLTGGALKDARVDFRAEGSYDAQGLQWKGSLDSFEGHFQGLDLVQTQPSRFLGDAEGMGGDLALKGIPVDAQGRPMAVEGAEVRFTGWAPFSSEAPIKVGASGRADLSDLKVLLDRVIQPSPYSLLADLRPSGRARFSLTLKGTYADPGLDGSLELQGGRLHVRTYPQSIDNVDFKVSFRDREFWIPQESPLRGTLAQGDLTAWGRATWQPGALRDYALETRLSGFQFRDIPEGFELQGSLAASLAGNDREGGRLTGRLDVDHMLYQADLDLADLILAGALGGSSSGLGLDPDDPLSRIELDLDLHLNAPWQFETNLLKLQGRPVGSFKVLGTAAHPGLKGKMDFIPGGRLTNLLPAGDIVLERGSIDFTDPRVFNPILNLQGRVDVSPYVVNLAITGSLNQLNMNPTSTPSLRQDEIVAILIDPSSASTIGTASGTSSQSAMSYGLAGTTSGLLTSLTIAGFQERVRRLFSLDRVNVSLRPSSTGTAETSVTLGKSLDLLGGAPLLFRYQKSGNDVTTSGQVEWRIGNLVLQLGASSSSTNGLSPAGEIRHTWTP